MNERVIFRVDGGNVYSLAMGHVYRCLKVAKIIAGRKVGADLIFVMKDYEKGVKKVEEEDFEVVQIPHNWTIEEEIDFIDEFTKDFTSHIFIADIRHINNEYIAIVKTNRGHVIYFDDLGGHSLKPDVIINPSIAASSQRYPYHNEKTDYYIGGKYFIIDRTIFLNPKDSIREKCNTILVSFGGADPCNLTCSILRTLVKLPIDINITVILGPAYNHHRELKKLLQTGQRQITIKTDVKNMYKEIMNADIGIVSGGDTCLEMIFTGTPAVVIPSIWYEKEVADYLVEKGAAKSIYSHEVEEKLLNTIEDLIHNYSERQTLNRVAKNLVDGKGAERVFEIIRSRMGRKSENGL